MNKQLSIFDKSYIKNKEKILLGESTISSRLEYCRKTTQNHEVILLDLFRAYYDARKNKCNTINQLQFEIAYEKNIIELYEEIISYNYKPKRSICFMINKPVKREIFAADFSDRVIHHLIYNYIMPIFDGTFINDSYSCRIGKGTHYGIGRINNFIRSCSQNYKQDCYVLKLDISGYFMAMDKKILFKQIKTTLHKKKHKINFDLQLILSLIKTTIFNDPTKNCIVKGTRKDWNNLPTNKSLFHSNKDCGLPIGNLTSQLFGNVYLNQFDHFVKRDLGIKYYGRYVDDFVLIHPNKEYLKSLIEPIRKYLQQELNLVLHPNKIYLQHYSKGLQYLGAIIKPNRIYVSKRTKGNFYNAIEKQNKIARNSKPIKQEQKDFQAVMNSYLGIMAHYKSHKLRKKMIFGNLSGWWWNYVYLTGGIKKFEMKMKTVK
ncbi:MAG: RNA-directed DNA polymerase [Bacteroidota bacterium]|nr:RNA-directed DNA polymerase [Bacteroidota bacterium]